MEMHFVPEQTAGAIIEILRYWVMEYHVDGFKLLGAGLPIAEQILTDCGFYPEEMKEILYAIENHRNKEMLKRDDLAGILYRADKMSRCCFGCRAEKECNWSTEKKNMEIQY